MTPENLVLNSHTAHKTTVPRTTTRGSLTNGKLYVANVQGVISYWAADEWRPGKPWGIVCGTPAPSVTFPSPNVATNGKAGMDAEFVFARPWWKGRCAAAQSRQWPAKWPGFQANTTATNRWAHPAVIGAPTAPTAHHTYRYALVGTGHPAQFELKDVYSPDNYGELKITVRPATASDCADNGWQAFRSSSEAVCDAQVS